MVDTAPVGVIVGSGSFDDDVVSDGLLESSEVLSGASSDRLPDVSEVGAGSSEGLVDPGVAGGRVDAEAELVAGLFEGGLPVCEPLPVVAAALEA